MPLRPTLSLALLKNLKKDPRAEKINLGVGIYKNEQGETPVLATVKKAEAALIETEKTKSYLTIEGTAEYGLAVQKLLFGADAEIVAEKRAKTAQAPGGTGALRVAGEFIKRQLGNVKNLDQQPNLGKPQRRVYRCRSRNGSIHLLQRRN